jgi:hypothetical protein
LEAAWQPEKGYCVPHLETYPHLWLWDSCFHSIAWAALRDSRALTELSSVLREQFQNGFVPHIVYGAENLLSRGPREDVSGYTQPPVYALSLSWVRASGLEPDDDLILRVGKGLTYFLQSRLKDGLTYVFHPWETGCDDSPRFDSWVGSSSYDFPEWTRSDLLLNEGTSFAKEGDAISNDSFVCSPSLFNAILSYGLLLVSELTGDAQMRTASYEIGESMDDLLWNDQEGMYVDRPLVGGGPSCQIPTLDGVLSALGSVSRKRAVACLDQLRDPARFAARFGLRYLPPDHPTYQPGEYWRGAAWPQLAFLAVRACERWSLDKLAQEIAEKGRASIRTAGWSEFWNPESGEGRGARPQTWAALAAAL